MSYDEYEKNESLSNIRNFFGVSGQKILNNLKKIDSHLAEHSDDVPEVDLSNLPEIKVEDFESVEIANILEDCLRMAETILQIDYDRDVSNVQEQLISIIQEPSKKINFVQIKKGLEKKLVSTLKKWRLEQLPRFEIKNISLRINEIIQKKKDKDRNRLEIWYQRLKNNLFAKYDDIYDVKILNDWMNFNDNDSILKGSDDIKLSVIKTNLVKKQKNQVVSKKLDEPGIYNLLFGDKKLKVEYLGEMTINDIVLVYAFIMKDDEKKRPLSKINNGSLFVYDVFLGAFYSISKNDHFKKTAKSFERKKDFGIEKLKSNNSDSYYESWIEAHFEGLSFYYEFIQTIQKLTGEMNLQKIRSSLTLLFREEKEPVNKVEYLVKNYFKK